MTGVVLGVDIGTSSSKAVLVTLDGAILASAVREHEVSRPQPGWFEMDAGLWWSEFVLLTPSLNVGNIVLWAGPFLAALGGVVLLLLRLRNRTPEPELSAAEADRLTRLYEDETP